MRLEVLQRQLAKGGLVGDGEPAGAEADDIVPASLSVSPVLHPIWPTFSLF